MYVIHIKSRKKVVLLTFAALLLTAVLALILPGCRAEDNTPIAAGTEEQRLAYLTSLGWETGQTPIETLDLQLPASLDDGWAAYAQLQQDQNLPFADFAGQTVRRYTYAVTNYPGVEKGVQVNLYVANDQLVGGDIISTGKNSFQTGLAFPAQEPA